MFSWYKYLIVNLVFSHLGFWSGNLFLIAPFPGLCLLVLFCVNPGIFHNLIPLSNEKTNNLHMRKQRRRSADQCLCFLYTDSTIRLLLISKVSGFQLYSVTVQPGLCQTWSETQIVGFLMHRLI